MSDDTAHAIDEEVRQIVDRNYERAEKILTDNLDKLRLMADALLKYETLDKDQIDDIMAGREPREPEGWDDDAGPKAQVQDSDADTSDEPNSDKPIGGPASLH